MALPVKKVPDPCSRGGGYSHLFDHELLELLHDLAQTEPLESGQALQEPAPRFHQHDVDFHLLPDAWMDHLSHINTHTHTHTLTFNEKNL